MRRKILGALLAISLLSICVWFSGRTAAQNTNDKPTADAGADMANMMKAAHPGPEHEKMKEMAGDWDADVQMAGPDGALHPSGKGTMHMEMLMDRFLQLKYEGSMNMGQGDMPFKGMGLSGYDNAAKKYWSTWVDSMSTGVMKTEGTMQDDKLVLTGKMTDPASSKELSVREVITHADKDHEKYELFVGDAADKVAKVMEINYTRKS